MKPAAAFTCTVPINPVTKKNSPEIVHYRKRNAPEDQHALLPSRQYEAFEEAAILFLRQQWQGRHPIEHPVNLKALFFRARDVGDLANYMNAICDCLERAGIVKNDRWIEGHDGSRPLIDRRNPRVEITLTPLPRVGRTAGPPDTERWKDGAATPTVRWGVRG